MSSVTLQPLSDDDMQLIYNWVDEIPLSRPKKNITRDFSDGGRMQAEVVLMAEVIYNFIPRLVEMHNYSAQHSVDKKIYNWQTLNCEDC